MLCYPYESGEITVIFQGVDGTYACVATTTQYCMVNFESGHLQDLFPYDSENSKPLIKRISKVSRAVVQNSVAALCTARKVLDLSACMDSTEVFSE